MSLKVLGFINLTYLGFMSSSQKILHQQPNCFHYGHFYQHEIIQVFFFFFRNPIISKSTGQYPDIHELYHCLHLPSISKNKTAVPQSCTKYLGEQDVVLAFRSVSLSFRSIPMTVLPGITEAFKICFNTWQSKSLHIILLFPKFIGSSCLHSLPVEL